MKAIFSIAVFFCLVVALGLITAVTLPRTVLDQPQGDDSED